MSVLNIKDFPEDLQQMLKAEAKRECRSVAQQVIYMLRQAMADPEPLSILSLRGLGKQVLQDVDAAAHVEQERDAWG